MAEPSATDQPVASSYADALAELDAILLGLQDERIDIDRLADHVRRAAQLVTFCRGRIVAARLEIGQVATAVEENDAPTTLE